MSITQSVNNDILYMHDGKFAMGTDLESELQSCIALLNEHSKDAHTPKELIQQFLARINTLVAITKYEWLSSCDNLKSFSTSVILPRKNTDGTGSISKPIQATGEANIVVTLIPRQPYTDVGEINNVTHRRRNHTATLQTNFGMGHDFLWSIVD